MDIHLYMHCLHGMIHTSTLNPRLRLLKQTDGNLSEVKQLPVLVVEFLSFQFRTTG